MEGAVAVVAAALLAYAVVERRLRPTPISGAIVFTAVGLLASEQGTGLISPSSHGHGAAAFPALTRHTLNVEGGVNDGLALPFVTIFLALALEKEGAVGGGHIAQVLLRSLVASGPVGWPRSSSPTWWPPAGCPSRA